MIAGAVIARTSRARGGRACIFEITARGGPAREDLLERGKEAIPRCGKCSHKHRLNLTVAWHERNFRHLRVLFDRWVTPSG